MIDYSEESQFPSLLLSSAESETENFNCSFSFKAFIFLLGDYTVLKQIRVQVYQLKDVLISLLRFTTVLLTRV